MTGIRRQLLHTARNVNLLSHPYPLCMNLPGAQLGVPVLHNFPAVQAFRALQAKQTSCNAPFLVSYCSLSATHSGTDSAATAAACRLRTPKHGAHEQLISCSEAPSSSPTSCNIYYPLLNVALPSLWNRFGLTSRTSTAYVVGDRSLTNRGSADSGRRPQGLIRGGGRALGLRVDPALRAALRRMESPLMPLTLTGAGR